MFRPNQGWSRLDQIWTKHRSLWLVQIWSGLDQKPISVDFELKVGLDCSKKKDIQSRQDQRKTSKKASASVRAYWGVAYSVAWNLILGMPIYVVGLPLVNNTEKRRPVWTKRRRRWSVLIGVQPSMSEHNGILWTPIHVVGQPFVKQAKGNWLY
jgi:hypothetical protein